MNTLLESLKIQLTFEKKTYSVIRLNVKGEKGADGIYNLKLLQKTSFNTFCIQGVQKIPDVL